MFGALESGGGLSKTTAKYRTTKTSLRSEVLHIFATLLLHLANFIATLS